MPVEFFSQSISMKVWDRVGIKLGTSGSAFGLTTEWLWGSVERFSKTKVKVESVHLATSGQFIQIKY